MGGCCGTHNGPSYLYQQISKQIVVVDVKDEDFKDGTKGILLFKKYSLGLLNSTW
jgi:hypothetical protein